MKQIWIVITFFISIYSEAQHINTHELIQANKPNVFNIKHAQYGQLSVHIYFQDDLWVVQANKIADDGFPDVVSIKKFSDQSRAINYAQNVYAISKDNKSTYPLKVSSDYDLGIPDLIQSITTHQSKNSLWVAKNTWNWDWEKKFAHWIKTQLHTQFFSDMNIANDCQDAFIQARMIFSYENQLPIAFRTAGGTNVFTQNTVRTDWLNLPTHADWRKNKRFLKALNYITDVTYTHTLSQDSYPIQITAESLIEGTVLLSLNQTSGHTLIVSEVNLHDASSSSNTTFKLPLYTLNSTVPKAVRPLFRSMFYQSNQPENGKYGYTGFVKLRWPKNIDSTQLVAATQMPYYSLEQYDPQFLTQNQTNNFSLAVYKRLNPLFSFKAYMNEGLSELKNMITERVKIVEDGYKACQNGCPVGSDNYENWSTPSRDKRLVTLFKDLEELSAKTNELYTLWQSELAKVYLSIDGIDYDLNTIQWVFKNNATSYDPNLKPDARWSLSPVYLAEHVYALTQSLLTKRELLVNSNTMCTNNSCTTLSDTFNNNSTILIDTKLQTIKSTIDQLIKISGDRKLTLFNDTLLQKKSSQTYFSNYLDLYNAIPHFNFDPRSSIENKWGLYKQKVNEVALNGNWNLYTIDTSDVLVLKRRNLLTTQYSFLNIPLKKVFRDIEISNNVVTEKNKSSQSILAWIDLNDNKLKVYNPINDKLISHTLKNKYSSDSDLTLKWINDQTLALDDASGVYTYSYASLAITDLHYFSGYTFEDCTSTSCSYISKVSKTTTANTYSTVSFELINLNDPNYAVISSDMISLIEGTPKSITHFRLTSLNPKLSVLAWYDLNSNPRTDGGILIDNNTNTTKKIDLSLLNSNGPNKKYAVDYESNKVTITFRDNNFTLLHKIDLSAENYRYFYPRDIVQIDNIIYYINDKKMSLDKIGSLSKSDTVQSISDDYLIVERSRDKESQYYIYNLNTDLIELSIPNVYLNNANNILIKPHLEIDSNYMRFQSENKEITPRINFVHEDITQIPLQSTITTYFGNTDFNYILNSDWEDKITVTKDDVFKKISISEEKPVIDSSYFKTSSYKISILNKYNKTIIHFF